jgi:hypothetical protein
VFIFVNAAWDPDMWFVALVYRTHVPTSHSFSSSRWTYTFSYLNMILTLDEIASSADLGTEVTYVADLQVV